jgi:hypothetical protein
MHIELSKTKESESSLKDIEEDEMILLKQIVQKECQGLNWVGLAQARVKYRALSVRE